MTLQNLLSELELMRALHPLTPCNVEAVDFNGCCVKLEQDQSAAEFEVEELRENNADLEKQLKASEEENNELTQQLSAHETTAETNGDHALSEAREEAERFRKAATDWASEVQEAHEEVTAMRKKKGVAVGFISQQRHIMDLLYSIGRGTDADGLKAKEILANIHR